MRRLLNSYIMRLLENKITLITGAGRGIGRVIAEQFAKDGATVYVNDLQEGDMATWADDCASRNGVKVVPVCFDVTDSAVNVFAVVDILQITSRLMARNGGGSFVNIASITGVAGSPGQVAYSSSKGAVIAMTKSAAKELSPLNIRVNAVAPGIIETERFKELYESDGDKIDQRISRIALGRLGTPQDVANAVSFLASDRASYISGHILGVDGCASI